MSGSRSYGAVSLAVVTSVRRHGVSLLLFTLATALAFGFVTTVAAGARRTSTAFDRFRDVTKGAHVMVDPGPLDGGPLDIADRLDRAPGVSSAGGFLYLPVAPVKPGVAPAENAGGFGALHESFGVDVYRYRVLEGRRANPKAEDEITVNEELADLADLHVGDSVELAGYQDVMRTRATVVGIHVGEFDLSANATAPSALFTVAFTQRWLPVFIERFGEQISPAFLVRVDDPSPQGQAAFAAWARDEFGPDATVFDASALAGQTSDAAGVQTIALAVLAAVAGIAAVFVLGQAADRMAAGAAEDFLPLRALGMRRRERAVVVAAPLLAAILLAGAASVAIAIVGSVTMPIGFARRIEPSPGVRVEFAILLPLAALLTLFVAGRAVVAARSHAGTPRAGLAPSVIRLPSVPTVSATVGVRWAFGGSGRASRTRSRSTLLAVVVAIAGVVAVLTFAGSEHRLLTTPRTHGWSFDTFVAAADGDPSAREQLLEQAEQSPAVEAYGSAFVAQLLVDEVGVDAFSFVGVRGDIHPTMIEGAAPSSGDDIVLGTRLARSLNKSVGDRVEVRTSEATRSMTVAGIAVFPVLGDGEFSYAMSVSEPGAESLGVQWGNQGVVARLRPGADRSDLRFDGPALGEIVEPYLPPSLLNLERAGNVPTLLAAFLGVLGTAAVAHALAVTARRSRREVAVLRCLGFVRRQVTTSVVWQATVYVAAAAVVATPVGVIIGRTAWRAVAAGLGVEAVVSVPVLAIVGALLAALAVSNGAAAFPAWLATRVHPAEVFHSE